MRRDYMNYKIDLHTHTNFSDGACSPRELINEAIKRNVKAIAITDHDSIDGIDEVAKLAKESKIDFLGGIEISCRYKNKRVIHIIGLGIDLNNEEFLCGYKKMKLAREIGVKVVLSKIRKQGININIEELKEKSLGKYLDRYDIYKYFIENEICHTPQEIWDKYLDPIPYGDNELIEVEEAIRMISNASGLSFLAHFNKSIGFAGFSNEEIEEEIRYLISIGLNGVERYYPSFKEVDYVFLDYLVNKYNLMISGGTDYHGENRPGIKLGSGENNNLYIPYDIYIEILCKLKDVY
ncbi:MAG: PHP domain-containing protein [Clostridium sp.]